jgi:hypothetical protein
MIPWNSPDLAVLSGSKRRRKYSLLQSWYRETELRVQPGRTTVMRGKKGERKEVEIQAGSLLPDDEATPRRRGLNFFMDPVVTAYVEKRAKEALAEGMTLEPNRLYRNMLSSMPMCFNLFGWLRGFKTEAAAALKAVLDLEIAEVTLIEVEWAPKPALLGDRSAFDAYIEYQTPDKTTGFLGVETKYTEPFSPTDYDKGAYTTLTEDAESGFLPGAAKHLMGSKTNQLWRNSLLALALRRRRGAGPGHAVVLACADDKGPTEALKVFTQWHRAPGTLVRSATLDALVRELQRCPATSARAAEFERRYLDTAHLSTGAPRP